MSHETKSWVEGVISILAKLEEPPCTSVEHSATCPTTPSEPSSQDDTTLQSFSPYEQKAPPGSQLQSEPRDVCVLESSESEKTVILAAKVWDVEGTALHVFRVKIDGAIFVKWNECWVEAYKTDLSFQRQRSIRAHVWGNTRHNNTYRRLSDVPRLVVGARFWIRGEPENDGLWEVVWYTHVVKIRRVLPSYFFKDHYWYNRIHSKSWDAPELEPGPTPVSPLCTHDEVCQNGNGAIEKCSTRESRPGLVMLCSWIITRKSRYGTQRRLLKQVKPRNKDARTNEARVDGISKTAGA